MTELGWKISEIFGDDRDSSSFSTDDVILIPRYNVIMLHESFTEEHHPDQWPLEF